MIKRARGYFLVELIAVLAVLSVVALLAAELFTSSVKTIRSSNQKHDALFRYDSMLATLRRDVGQSLLLSVQNGNVLVIQTGYRDECRWAITPEGATRTQAGTTRTWTQLPKDMTFEQRGRLVVMHVPVASDLVLAPPTLLLKGARP